MWIDSHTADRVAYPIGRDGRLLGMTMTGVKTISVAFIALDGNGSFWAMDNHGFYLGTWAVARQP